MPIDSQKLVNNKDRIISFLKLNGPSLPVKIARAINNSPLFTSAFLSELYGEKKVKMSDLKVGSSPLYYLQGQENHLEKFSDYLNQREKEAFLLLKKDLLLEDETLSPVMRVAIRSLKDFAVPIRIRVNEELKLFWKHFLIEDSKIKDILNNKLIISSTQQSMNTPQSLPTEISSLKKEKIIDKEIKSTVEKLQHPKPKEVDKKIEESPKIAKEKKIKKIESKFSQNIQEYLKAKDIEIIQIIEEKKKEFVGKIRINTLFGKQELYLIAKDKKKINETDLNLALQKAHSEKMPSLIIAPGEIDKKAIHQLKEWRNLLKFEKIIF